MVYGLWGIFVLIPLLRKSVFPLLRERAGLPPVLPGPIYGPSMLAAGIILAIMVMPYIMSVSREVLMAVPNTQREAALALGATRWEAVITAVVPYARSGHHRRRHPRARPRARRDDGRHDADRQSPRDRGFALRAGYTMAAAIANEFSEAVGDMHLSALAYVAFLLFVVTVLVNAGRAAAHLARRPRLGRREQGAVNRRSRSAGASAT